MKTIGKTKIICFARRRHEKENRSVQCGFMRFFRFAELLPIGAGSAKRNDGPQCPPQANFFGDLGCVLYKKHGPSGGQRPPQAEIFGHLGGVVHKNHVAGMHSGTCFWRKTPPKSSKFSASGGQIQPNGRNNPPPLFQKWEQQGGVRRYWLI